MTSLLPQSDVGALWKQALDAYEKTTGVNMRQHLQTQPDINSIIVSGNLARHHSGLRSNLHKLTLFLKQADQQRQLAHFEKFRHSEGKLDRFRSTIAKSVNVVRSFTTIANDIVCVAFPPASAVLTAFTLVLTASDRVSADYDSIESFFSVVQAFLQRLSLLEGKFPPQEAIQKSLVQVFSSLLVLSGIAHAYRTKGRISRWTKNLVDRNDTDLCGAFDKLNSDLSQLESAVILQTLRTTMEISAQTMSTREEVKEIHDMVRGSSYIALQLRDSSDQTLSIVSRIETEVRKGFQHFRDNANTLPHDSPNTRRNLEASQSKVNKNKERVMKAGASRPMNFERLRREYLANAAERSIAYRFADIKNSHVRRVFDWIDQDPAFQSITNSESSLLWVRGKAGMGKSTISLAMFQHLHEKFSFDPATSVAWFSFDEELPEMRSIGNMLRYCSIQVAMDDEEYCRETSEALRRSGPLQIDEDAWHHLIEARYRAKSNRRLFLVLDGIDEVGEEDFNKLITRLGQLRSKECSVRVIFTSSPQKQKDIAVLEAPSVDLTRDKIMGDMYKYATAKVKTLQKLRKLRPKVQRKVVRKVVHKADSFLYIDHTFRRLNSLGREGTVLKALEFLADNTDEVYHSMLTESLEDRTPDERETLRKLFAWLAYAKAKVSVAEINYLITVLQTNKAISIEDEIDGRLSRLLRVYGNRAGNELDNSSADENRAESTVGTQSESEDEELEDANNFLLFQERSLKAYFCQTSQNPPDGLRCTAVEAHIIIIQACSAILATPSIKYRLAGRLLEIYAVKWLLFHLHEVPPNEGAVSSDLAKVVIESIYTVFTNYEALRSWEELTPVETSILSGEGLTQGDTLGMLSAWAQRALCFVSAPLPDAVMDWYQIISREPLRVFLGLARAHVTNWFAATSQEEAFFAFRSAHRALQEGRHLPEVKQDLKLHEYLSGFKADKDEAFDESSFGMLLDYFKDIERTSSSYKGIGMAMKYRGMYGPAVDQLNKGLNDKTIDNVEEFELLGSKGQGLLELAKSEEEGELRRQHLEECISVYNQANSIYQNMENVEDIKDARWQLCWNLQNMACAAALLGQFDDALKIFTQALGTKEYIHLYIISNLFDAFKKAEQHSIMMDMLKRMTRRSVAEYLLLDGDGVVQEAAVRAEQGASLLEMYARAQKVVETTKVNPALKDDQRARLQSSAATFQRQALGHPDEAKRILHEMIDSSKTPDWCLLEACNLLADILFEEFRTSNVPSVKHNALAETRQLLTKPKEALPKYYNAEESHITILVALMLKRIGPAQEYQDHLDGAFKNCVRQLRDDTGMNDASALRRLARILNSTPGFTEDASIALTLQFYIIDVDVHKLDVERIQGSLGDATPAAPANEKAVMSEDADPREQTELNHHIVELEQSIGAPIRIDAVSNPPATDDKDGAVDKTISDDNKDLVTHDSIPSATGNEMEEGLLPDKDALYCNMCGKWIWDFSGGAVYYCVYCIDCDLCEDCYAKKVLRDKGELEPDWRVVCPKGHRQVKAPIDGWRGVKNGTLRIGERETPFKVWLQGLEDRWMEYWAEFWMETDEV